MVDFGRRKAWYTRVLVVHELPLSSSLYYIFNRLYMGAEFGTALGQSWPLGLWGSGAFSIGVFVVWFGMTVGFMCDDVKHGLYVLELHHIS